VYNERYLKIKLRRVFKNSMKSQPQTNQELYICSLLSQSD